jgi:hypothetical protein
MRVSASLVLAVPKALDKFDPALVMRALEANESKLHAVLRQAFAEFLTLPVCHDKQRQTVVEIGEITVNYDVSIRETLAARKDIKSIGWATERASDEHFPCSRRGEQRFKAFAVRFGQAVSDDDIQKWCRNASRQLATPKDALQLAYDLLRPRLDDVMPLAIAGQSSLGTDSSRDMLYFDAHGVDERRLDVVSLALGAQWSKGWWFLILERLP